MMMYDFLFKRHNTKFTMLLRYIALGWQKSIACFTAVEVLKNTNKPCTHVHS